jgi:hypothetical protein
MPSANRARHPTRFAVAVYLFAALALDGCYQLHRLLGGRGVDGPHMRSTFLFFALWMPLVPVMVALARRFAPARGRRLRALDVHFFAALALSALTLAAHKLAFCSSLECMTYYEPGPWLARWLALDFLFYGAVTGGVWLLDAHEASRAPDVHAAAVARELASAELQLVHAQVDPRALIELFDWLRAHLGPEPARAERMVTRLADYLRLNVAAISAAAIGATCWTVADDAALLGAWLRVESLRRDATIDFETALDDGVSSLPIPSPIAQPLAARSLPQDAARVTLAAGGGTIILTADGVELGRAAIAA